MPLWSRSLAIVSSLAFVAFGFGLGVKVSGPKTYHTALGSVKLTMTTAAQGEVAAYVPLVDWGVKARAFKGPFSLLAEPALVNRSALLSVASGKGALVESARQDLISAGRAAVARGLKHGLIGSLIASLLLALLWGFGRGPGSGILSLGLNAVTGLLLTGLSLAVIAVTYNSQAFERPTYYAQGGELSQLLASSSRIREKSKEYRIGLEDSLRYFASILATSQPSFDRSVFVGSDLHNNFLVLKSLEKLTAKLPLFLAGDFGDKGDSLEAELLKGLNKLGSPVVAVSGNHDTSLIMGSLAKRGVRVLGRQGELKGSNYRGPKVRKIAGFKIAGFDDPLEYRGKDPRDPSRKFSFDAYPGGERDAKRSRYELINWFEGLKPKPQLVMVHQQGLALGLARHLTQENYLSPLIILTGHDHRQHLDIFSKNLVIIDGGSLGAGGQFGIAREPVGLAGLHFRGTSLAAVDLIKIEPVSQAAQAQRVVITKPDCKSELVRCPEELGALIKPLQSLSITR